MRRPLNNIIVQFTDPDRPAVFAKLRSERPGDFQDLPADYVPLGKGTVLKERRDRIVTNEIYKLHTGECRRQLFSVLQELRLRDEQITNLSSLGILVISSLSLDQRRAAMRILALQPFVAQVVDDEPIRLASVSDSLVLPSSWYPIVEGRAERVWDLGSEDAAPPLVQSIVDIAGRLKLSADVRAETSRVRVFLSVDDDNADVCGIFAECVETLMQAA